MQILSLLLTAPSQGEGNPLSTFLPLILILVVFYFFMIRPQMKKSKELKKFRESIEKGSRVVTIGGIHGKVVEVHEGSVTLDIGCGRIKIEKSAISMDSSGMLTEESKKATA